MIKRIALPKIVSSILKHPKIFLLGSLIIALSSLPFAIKLYANLQSGIEELLPRSAPSIKALDQLRARLGDNLQLTVLISGAGSEDLHRFADRFSNEAENIVGKNRPRFIDYRPSVLQDFYKNRKFLFVSLEDLDDIKKALKDKMEAGNPLLLGIFPDENSSKVDLEKLLRKYEKQEERIPYFPTGYYESKSNDSIVMIFYPINGVGGYEDGMNFKKTIDEKAKEVSQSMGLQKIKLEYSGDVESIIQEQKSLQTDLLYSTTFVLLIESLLIFFFFRWMPSLLVLGLPLLTGVLLTFAISYFAIGSVNLTTAFLGSIIIGNGVNAGIILLARFVEERRKNQTSEQALEIAIDKTWRLTIAASMAAAIAYASLMITTFRGYSQFGFIGALGMMLCWCTTYLFSPAFILVFDRQWPVKRHKHSSTIIDNFFMKFSQIVLVHKKNILRVSFCVSIAAFALAIHYAQDPLEYDTTKLRSSSAVKEGGYLQVDTRAEEILRHNILPVVVLLKDKQDVQKVYQSYKKNVNSNSILGSVLTMQSLIPEQQPEKIEALKSLIQVVPEKKRKHLKGTEKKYYETAREASQLGEFSTEDLPEILRRQFRETSGAEGNLVLLFPKNGTNTRDGRVVLQFAKEVRSVTLPTGAYVAGTQLVFADMLAAISHDGPIATLFSFAAVIWLSLWLARGSVSGSFLITLSLLVGVLWTIALIEVFDIKINFLNFIALPITFGVGLDYAVNVYGRYNQSHHELQDIKIAIAHSGSAVLVCSGTTIIGYTSLLFSKNGALFSFGTLAILGEIGCLIAALIVLPSMIKTNKEKTQRSFNLFPSNQSKTS